MTAKADEPRTCIKIPVSIRDQMCSNAKTLNTTMLDYITRLVKCDTEHNFGLVKKQ